MKFSEQWLREWVNPNVNHATLVQQLTQAGLEVENSEPIAGDFSEVVVGHVVTAVPHPDADRLRHCQVDIGEAETLSIVCGGTNVATGMKIALAKVGGHIGDLKMRKAKLRGVLSLGMICSAKELGLSETSDGTILELAADAPVGMDIKDYLKLNDFIIDINVTPNRGDCLSMQGVAREVAAINEMPYVAPAIESAAVEHAQQLEVKVKQPELCPLYAGRVIHDVNNTLKLPLEITERLARSGVREVNPIVDLCNYVMLEFGQPMHAFDLNELNGHLEVRLARNDEQLTLLDETHVALDSQTLVIADALKPVAMAGIMGGKDSGVTENTQSIFLESAYFKPSSISRSVRHYKLNTDASFRFERNVDPQLVELALERVTQLIGQYLGGKSGAITCVRHDQYLPQINSMVLRVAQVKRLLGYALPSTTIVAILKRLEFIVNKVNDDAIEVQVPSYRHDIKREIDLIEEVARIYGYQNIPEQPMRAELNMAALPERRLMTKQLENLLVAGGFREVISYSFIDPGNFSLLNSQTPVVLANPLNQDQSVMRASIWPGLLNIAKQNLARQQTDIRLFEHGLCFWREGDEIIQLKKIAILLSGTTEPKQWGHKAQGVDFFSLKGMIEHLLQSLHCRDWSWQAANHPALHPGQTAALYHHDQPIGFLGALHPAVAKKLGFKQPIYLFESEFDALFQAVAVSSYEMISKYPRVTRDLALIVDRELPVQELINKITSSNNKLLKNVEVFDIYEGESIGSGKKSVALSLNFQALDYTLEDEKVEQMLQIILSELQQTFAAHLRT